MNTVRITSQQFETTHKYILSDKKKESAVFLTAGFFQNEYGYHFTVRDVLIPKEHDYNFRSNCYLEVSPIFFNKTITMAEQENLTVIQCHSHPFSKDILEYSRADFDGESVSAQTIHDCLNEKPMGSMLFGQKMIRGRIWLPSHKEPIEIEQIRIIDRHIQLRYIGHNHIKEKQIDEKLFDRQIRIFGINGQKILSSLKVGIVGAGGTGSAVAEQLAREGIYKFVLVDQDKFSESNKTRMYGSYNDTTQTDKVKIVKDHIQRINSDAIVEEIAKNVISQKVLKRLRNCDVIFSCTDRNAPRSVLNELAYQYFIPVIDLGVGIDANNNMIDGGSVRVNILGPSLPCLFCVGIINSEQILAESLSPKERKIRYQQGYVQSMNDDVPAVITFTTMAASYAIFLLKDMFFNIIESNNSTLLIDIKSLAAHKLSASIRKDCTCIMRTGKGSYMPLSAPAGDHTWK